eukprot:1391303-Pleurochrysis_carterae.AAC.1
MRKAEGAREAAKVERDAISHEAMLLRRKLERGIQQAGASTAPLLTSRTADEWAALSRDAARLAAW